MTPISYYELPLFGVNPLTSEACAFGMRTLCDLNEEGLALIADWLSVKAESFNASWNSKVNGKPAVASVMIDREAFPRLMLFALWRAGCDFAIEHDEAHYTGLKSGHLGDRPHIDEYLKWQQEDPQNLGFVLHRSPVLSSQPREGSRNVHGFTGRSG